MQNFSFRGTLSLFLLQAGPPREFRGHGVRRKDRAPAREASRKFSGSAN